VKRESCRAPDSRLHIVCPFCGFYVDWMTELRWCSGCYVEWFKRGDKFIFDNRRKTPRFAFAKALQRSGGASMGSAPTTTKEQ
jgi:hypothetical protein